MSTHPAATDIPAPVNRHVPTPVEMQRMSLQNLLKDPSKPVNIPPPPKEKTLRPPREMMKNVQGSSAGAGSGEFHVYKANRRREYERLKIMEEKTQQEKDDDEFERRKREREEMAEAKTAKNRAKRQKKKGLRDSKKGKAGASTATAATGEGGQGRDDSTPIKKRRLVMGQQVIFKKPGDESEYSSDDEPEDFGPGPAPAPIDDTSSPTHDLAPAKVAPLTIIDDD